MSVKVGQRRQIFLFTTQYRAMYDVSRPGDLGGEVIRLCSTSSSDLEKSVMSSPPRPYDINVDVGRRALRPCTQRLRPDVELIAQRVRPVRPGLESLNTPVTTANKEDDKEDED